MWVCGPVKHSETDVHSFTGIGWTCNVIRRRGWTPHLLVNSVTALLSALNVYALLLAYVQSLWSYWILRSHIDILQEPNKLAYHNRKGRTRQFKENIYYSTRFNKKKCPVQHTSPGYAIFLNKGCTQHKAHTKRKCAIMKMVVHNIEHTAIRSLAAKLAVYHIAFCSIGLIHVE